MDDGNLEFPTIISPSCSLVQKSNDNAFKRQGMQYKFLLSVMLSAVEEHFSYFI